MKIRKSVLQDALKVLGKVVSQTSLVEAQRSMRFLSVGAQAWLTATDGVESVTVEVAGNAGDMEDFTVEYKALRELIRSTRGGEVEVTGKRLDWPETEAVPDDAVTIDLPPDFGRLLALATPVVICVKHGSRCGGSIFPAMELRRRTVKSCSTCHVR